MLSVWSSRTWTMLFTHLQNVKCLSVQSCLHSYQANNALLVSDLLHIPISGQRSSSCWEINERHTGRQQTHLSLNCSISLVNPCFLANCMQTNSQMRLMHLQHSCTLALWMHQPLHTDCRLCVCGMRHTLCSNSNTLPPQPDARSN